MDSTTPLIGGNQEPVNPTRALGYILLLTVIVGGLQLSYSAEFANGTPFLLSLGISKPVMSLVWIAGPLSGAIGQPLVGILSDETRLKYGRRRPFILTGAIATITSLLMLSWSKDIVSLFLSDRSEETIKRCTQPFAVIMIYVLDFSIQVIQAATRAFIVDNVPTHQQQIANAWAARMIGIGNIVGYVLGSTNLPKGAPFLGDTQFKVLSACACIALVLSVAPSCLNIRERDPNTDPTVKQLVNIGERDKNRFLQVWDDTIVAIKNLSPQSRLVCHIQFFAWIGYFPMLFYTTTYVGELYVSQVLRSRDPYLPPLSQEEREALDEAGTRKGTQALVVYSVSSLIFNFLLPYITQENYLTPEEPKSMDRLLGKLTVPGLTVARVWAWSHILFACLALWTFWIKTSQTATLFVGFLGFTWAVSQWAPFTIISQEVSRIMDKKSRATGGTETSNHPLRYMHYEHQAGVVLGVMNVFVSLPQVVASLAASIIFRLTDSPDNNGESVGWVFRFGGLAALVAAYLTFFVKNPQQLDREDEFVQE